MNSFIAATGASFWSNGFGAILASFMQVIGILVVLFAIFRVIQHVAKGEVSKAVKAVLGSVVLAVFLIQPPLINSTIDASSGVVSSVISTISNLAGGGSNSTPSTTIPPAVGSTTN